jgi:hypothetical protein
MFNLQVKNIKEIELTEIESSYSVVLMHFKYVSTQESIICNGDIKISIISEGLCLFDTMAFKFWCNSEIGAIAHICSDETEKIKLFKLIIDAHKFKGGTFTLYFRHGEFCDSPSLLDIILD